PVPAGLWSGAGWLGSECRSMTAGTAAMEERKLRRCMPGVYDRSSRLLNEPAAWLIVPAVLRAHADQQAPVPLAPAMHGPCVQEDEPARNLVGRQRFGTVLA